jgi:hypothetical protein
MMRVVNYHDHIKIKVNIIGRWWRCKYVQFFKLWLFLVFGIVEMWNLTSSLESMHGNGTLETWRCMSWMFTRHSGACSLACLYVCDLYKASVLSDYTNMFLIWSLRLTLWSKYLFEPWNHLHYATLSRKLFPVVQYIFVCYDIITVFILYF